MTSPKHLWSGDWKEESAAAARERAGRDAPPRLPAEPPPPPAGRPSSAERVAALLRAGLTRLSAAGARARRALADVRTGLKSSRLRRALRAPVLLAIALAMLLIAGGAYGVAALVGSGSSSPANASARAPWLGVQMESLPLGGVVVATVAPGSPAEVAGLEPGDVISEINNRPINTVADVQSAVDGLRAGDTLEVQVSRGSTIYTTDVTLAAHPPGYP